MSKLFVRRSLGLMLSALLIVALPVTALAAQEADTTELTASHVTLDETEFEYTGSQIRPNVTVRAEEHLLTLDKEYRLAFADNTQVGTAKVIVTGIGTAGYTGRVEIPFTIREKAPEAPEFTLVELQDSHVQIDGSEFAYTGSPITPGVTVTVGEQVLVRDRDYAVEYVNNLVPGTAAAIVRGIVTASETQGYSGEVRIPFAILPIPETETPEETTPETGETTPETEAPEETQPQTPQNPTPSYQITQGSGGKWYQGSGKTLGFTANGSRETFSGVSVNGRALEQEYYTLSQEMTVTLKNSFLQKLPQGQHRIVLHFADGEAAGTFRIAAGLDTSNPETGDAFPLHFLTAVLFVSLTGLIGIAMVCFLRKNRKTDE